MRGRYLSSMAGAVQRLYDEQDDVTGVVLASAKKTFFAGGNLKSMVTATPDELRAAPDVLQRYLGVDRTSRR